MHCFLQLFSTGYERKKRGCLKTFETPSIYSYNPSVAQHTLPYLRSAAIHNIPPSLLFFSPFVLFFISIYFTFGLSTINKMQTKYKLNAN